MAGEVASTRVGSGHVSVDHEPLALALHLEFEGRAGVGAVDDDLVLRHRGPGAGSEYQRDRES